MTPIKRIIKIWHPLKKYRYLPERKTTIIMKERLNAQYKLECTIQIQNQKVKTN